MRLPLSGKAIYSTFFKYRSTRFIPWIMLLLFLQGCGEEVKKMRVPAVELYQEAFVAFEDEYYQEAEKKFQDLVDEHPNTQLATLAYLKMGDLNFKRSKWEDAEVNYRMFLTLNPQSHLTPYVLNRIIALNFEKNYYGIFFPSRNFDRNMEPNRTILKEFRRFFLLYPQSPYLEEIREYQLKARAELAEHEFLVGDFYFRGKLYTSAAERYLYLLQNYPEFPRTEEVARKLIQAYRLNGEPLLANEMEEVLSSFLQRQVSSSGNS